MAKDEASPEAQLPDPEKVPRPSASRDHGRLAVLPHELQWGDRLFRCNPFKPESIWRPVVVSIKKRRRKKGGYVVEVKPEIYLQLEEDELTVIDRPTRQEVAEAREKQWQKERERRERWEQEEKQRQEARPKEDPTRRAGGVAPWARVR